MPPIWPFKKKKEMVERIDEAPPAPVVYRRGEDPNARAAIETDAGAYKDALALFGGGSSEVSAATDQSVHYDGTVSPSGAEPASQNDPQSQPVEAPPAAPSKALPSYDWVHHTDGYHYKQHADGTFEPTPHVKQADGTYAPYS